MGSYKDYLKKVKAGADVEDNRIFQSEADTYLGSLEKSAYGDAGRKYGAGLGQITNFLARSGPLADSGAGTALRTRLASNVYGGAQSRIGNCYADFIRRALEQRRQFNYQQALDKQRDRRNKKGPLDYLAGAAGGAAGFALGGPAGAAAGYGVGSSLGGSQGADNYANYGYG